MEKRDQDAQGFVTVLPRKRQKKRRTPKTLEEALSFVDRMNLTIANIEGSDWIRECYGLL